jgi:aminoglycoside 3-N-acetyltransferase I
LKNRYCILSENHLVKVIAKQEHLVFVALPGNKVIAGLTAYILEVFEEEKLIVYIIDLAVKTEYQRKGIGQKLIKEINTYCGAKSISEVFIQADAVDEYAVEFYRKIRGKK